MSTEAASTEAASTEAASSETEQALADAERRPRTRAEGRDSVVLARAAAAAALDRQAVDLKVLELAKVSDFTDYFVLATGNNDRQVQAIADAVRDALRDEGVKPLHVEGYNLARWVLMDYGGDLIVHVFRDEARRFYDLERLWSDAPDVTDELTSDS